MLEGLEGVVNVIDDILVRGETTEEHDHRLIKLLERAREWNLKLNKSKCQIKMSTHLGHIISEEVLKPNDEK